MAEVSLEFLAEQISRVLEEQADMREQMTVLTGMVLRLDDGMTALLAHARLAERRMARLEKRVDALENAS
jgi:hypothetical protein